MGSRLYFPEADLYWDPDSTRRMFWWIPLALRSDDDNRRDLYWERPAGPVFDRDAGATRDQSRRGWTTAVAGYYRTMLLELDAHIGPAYAVGYDWRQDIGRLGAYAAAKIRAYAADARQPVAVVTHSMGGLVLRSALRSDRGLGEQISAVVQVCPPSVGAVVLYRRLFTGLIPGPDGGGKLFDRLFRLLLGDTRAAFLGNVSGLPGAMQLLPSEYFPRDAAGRPWNSLLDQLGFAALYPAPDSPPGVAPVTIGLSTEVLLRLRERVSDIAAFHTSLGPPGVPAHPNTFLVYGPDRPTEVRWGSADNVQPLGDEVVPATSATALGLPPERVAAVSGVVHPDACSNRDVIRAVGRFLGFPVADAPAEADAAAAHTAALRLVGAVAPAAPGPLRRVRVTVDIELPNQ
jgi:hypothetical protein